MKSPMLLWRKLTEELGEWCRVSTIRDLNTASERVEHEGLSFLTITLPNFAKDFEEALADGYVAHGHFAGFQRNGGLPRFLGGFLGKVFDTRTGILLEQPDTDAVFAVRQICRFAAKILLPTTDRRKEKAYASYVQVERELESAYHSFDPASMLDFLRVSRLLFGDVLFRMDFQCGTGRLKPNHGPGATADYLMGNQKMDQREWPVRLEAGGFSAVDFLLPNARYHRHLDLVQFLDPGAERPVRVIAVPKTLKTPRIIAIEPTCMQYAQQSIARPLMKFIEGDPLVGPFVGFTDQVPNQELAKQGSKDASLATLDLSEASDRVANQLVLVLLQGYTHLSEAVQACRSLTADVPGHGKIPLSKFASMGSALCFPMEAMCFITLVFLGIQRAKGTKLTRKDIKSMTGQVRVYGDDIIVPTEYALSVIQTLEEFAFRVNEHKSFWSGNFRESCGRDYFNGVDVTTIKCRTELPSSRRDVKEIVSTVSLRNQLFKRGFVSTVEYLDKLLENLLVDYPEVSETSPLLGKFVHGPPSAQRTNRDLHNPESKGWRVSATSPINTVDDIGALLKFFLKDDRLPSVEKHLERSGRPRAVNIKRGWAPV